MLTEDEWEVTEHKQITTATKEIHGTVEMQLVCLQVTTVGVELRHSIKRELKTVNATEKL